jgi:hypothetical protein
MAGAIGLLLLECGAPYRATSDGMLPLDLYKVDLDEDDEEENLPLFLELSKAATSYFSLVRVILRLLILPIIRLSMTNTSYTCMYTHT